MAASAEVIDATERTNMRISPSSVLASCPGEASSTSSPGSTTSCVGLSSSLSASFSSSTLTDDLLLSASSSWAMERKSDDVTISPFAFSGARGKRPFVGNDEDEEDDDDAATKCKPFITSTSTSPTPPVPAAAPSVDVPSLAALSAVPDAGVVGLCYDTVHRRHHHPHRKHPERPERVDAVMSHLEACGLLEGQGGGGGGGGGKCRVLPCVSGNEGQGEASDAATEAMGVIDKALHGVHNPHYLRRLKRLENATLPCLLEEAEQFDSVYFNEHSIACAKKAAGGLMMLVKEVVLGKGSSNKKSIGMDEDDDQKTEGPLPPMGGKNADNCPKVRNGLALIRPPGHHAEAHHARGFCVINNVAVAAQYARQSLGINKVLIVDWDIHHGNGTQRMFLHDPSVLYFSVHRYDHGRFFPGTGSPHTVGEGNGQGYTVNIGWNTSHMGDREYKAVWSRVLLPIAQAYHPELILVSAGFDGAKGDEMGACDVTPEAFGWMTRALMEQVPSAHGQVVLALEGGYKLSVLSRCVEECVRALMTAPAAAAAAATGKEDDEEEDEHDGQGGSTRGSKRIRKEEESDSEEEEEVEIKEEAEEAIRTTIEVQKKYWPFLGGCK